MALKKKSIDTDMSKFLNVIESQTDFDQIDEVCREKLSVFLKICPLILCLMYVLSLTGVRVDDT